MCAPLRVLRLRSENEPEDQVLRVRLEAGVQEVLREVSRRVEETPAASTRSHPEEGWHTRLFLEELMF